MAIDREIAMSVLSAQSILQLCKRSPPLIFPFVERGVSHGRSYGLSGCSYDVRIEQTIWLWPFWGRLASTMERFDMPDNVCATVKDKSSNARRFILVQNTFVDAGWRGYLTLELIRIRPWPVRIKAGTPIAQFVFQWLDEPTELPYRGKYQNQPCRPIAAKHEPPK